jgi:uracil phosphoribosyltransferase
VHTLIRDIAASRADFLFYSDQLIRTIIEFAFETVPYQQKCVTTPTGHSFQGLELTKEIIGVSVMRAGESMEAALRATVRDVKIGKILIQRDESSPTKSAKLFYSKLPEDLASSTVMLLDPMLASGSSAALAIQVLLDRGVKEEDIIFVNLIAAPEGVAALYKQYPKITVVTTMIDECLNSEKYILPGIGDFGDRYYLC